MPITILSENPSRIVFDERSTNLDELLTVARHKWPEALMDHVVVRPPYNENMFALSICCDGPEEFRSDGQLTINPCITLGQLFRATSAKPGEAYRETVSLCWNEYTLHLKRPVKIPA